MCALAARCRFPSTRNASLGQFSCKITYPHMLQLKRDFYLRGYPSAPRSLCLQKLSHFPFTMSYLHTYRAVELHQDKASKRTSKCNIKFFKRMKQITGINPIPLTRIPAKSPDVSHMAGVGNPQSF
ncbi:hypothetical protein AVEN_179557-1 [Araneus ventricosus]|uniref:Uncharacterized protein n=1 Tax=Araneus ventricosus TaxID=182803 RepID=A0A4Y2BEN9_ARAVE|nr:hypothetical protein AVEN_179557-1 [Araneus ventricosus]